MSDVASGVGGQTNKKSNEEGVSNEEQKNKTNGRRSYKSGCQYRTAKFKGRIQGLLTLGVKDFWDFFWE